MAEHVESHRIQLDAGEVERRQLEALAAHLALHLRRFAEKDVHRHVDVDDRRPARAGVGRQRELALLGGNADHGERAALALAHRLQHRQRARLDGEHVALLALVAPDLLRRQAALLDRDRRPVEAAAAAGAVDQLGEGVREAAGADVVDGQDRVGGAEGGAVVDDLLGPALDLGIAALHRIEIELGCVGAGGHRAGGAAAHADPHARPAQLQQQRAGRELDLVRLRSGDRPEAAGDHDRLVIAAPLAADRLLVDAEVAAEIGPPELVVEGGAAERPPRA